jgi:hypothetical protein
MAFGASTPSAEFTRSFFIRNSQGNNSMEIRVELKGVGRGRTAAYFKGEHLGTWSDPIWAVARLLLARGEGSASDMLVGCRDGRPVISGGLGWFAARTVIENAKTGPKFAKWHPMPTEGFDARTTVASKSTSRIAALSDTAHEETAVHDATLPREIALA